jgi:hypothetical protein
MPRPGDVTSTAAVPISARSGYGEGMIETSTTCKRHRFPAWLIAYAMWLYFRFPLSLRLVEELLVERGIVVPYETMRR